MLRKISFTTWISKGAATQIPERIKNMKAECLSSTLVINKFEKVLTYFSDDLWFFSVYFVHTESPSFLKVPQVFASSSKLLSELLTPQLTWTYLGSLGFFFPKKFSAWITKSLGKSQIHELQVARQCKVFQGRVTQYFFFFLLSMSHCHTQDRLCFPSPWHWHDMKWFTFPKIHIFVFFPYQPENKHFRTWVSNSLRGSTKLPDPLAPN